MPKRKPRYREVQGQNQGLRLGMKLRLERKWFWLRNLSSVHHQRYQSSRGLTTQLRAMGSQP